MAPDPFDVRQAWLVLRSTRLKLPALTPQAAGSSTGYSPGVAFERLLGQWGDSPRIEHALHAAILQHFTAFADSWDAYIDQRGWLIDLLRSQSNLRERIAARFQLGPLLATAEALRSNPHAPLTDFQQWGPLLGAASKLERRREAGEHPAAELMVAKYGLEPELAKTVLLHSRIEPWWAHLAMTGAWLICALIFLLALVEPHNPAFANDSVGGVGPLHYIVLPLFALLFLAAQVWLIKTRPRRQHQWRAQLAVYLQAWETAHGG